VLSDAGYDLLPIYQQVERMGARALIDYNRRNEPPEEGVDKYFRPLCKKDMRTDTTAMMRNTKR
jgi:hypothetical protein